MPAKPSPRPAKTLRGRIDLNTVLKLIALIFAIGIPAIVAAQIRSEYNAALSDAELRATNISRALGEHATRTIDTIDAYLQAILSLTGPALDQLPGEVIHKALRDRLMRSDNLVNIYILDSAGETVQEAGSFPARQRMARDRDFFDTLRDRPDTELVIGKRILGEFSGKPTIPVARRIIRADGSFGGVIVASLDPAAFQRVYDSIDNGRGATLALWRSDGVILVRTPHDPDLIGRNFSSSRNYLDHVPTKDTKPFWAKGVTDGVERVIAFGFVERVTPLYVSTAIARDTALEPWRRSALLQATVAGLLTLLLVGGLLALDGELKRRKRADAVMRDAERATNEANRLLLQAADLAQIGNWRLSVPSNAVIWSEGVFRIFGRDMSDGEPSLQEALAAYHPDDQASVGRLVRDAAAKGEDFAFSARIVRGQDDVRDVVCRGLCETDDRGQTETIFGVIMDVTELRRTERAAVESERRYRLLAENASDIIMVRGPEIDDRRPYVSPSCRAVLGYAPEEFQEIASSDIVHPDDLSRVVEVYGSISADSPEGRCVYRVRHKEGRWVWVEALFKRFIDASQPDEPSILATVRDVTERQRQAAHLEEAKAAAEAAATIKAEFLANMSHELRTPLTGMLGIHDLLRSDPDLSANQARLIGLAHDSGQALLAIINDTLDFSKIDAGHLSLELVPFSLGALVASCGALISNGNRNDRLQVSYHVAHDTHDILIGDVTRLRQIILNLGGNAVKFTPQGRISIEAVYDAAQGRLRVEVADTGIGIAADKLPSLFERFTQADSSTTRRYGGSGLGLAICKRLVELMGGEIGVTSEPGKGSVFWFEAPLGTAADDAANAHSGHAISASKPRALRILVAEDNDINREIIATVLTKKGHDIETVVNGAEAVTAIETMRVFDVVLMDMQMPVLDGVGAARAIRQSEAQGRDLPIVALTANALPEEIARCLAAGMNAHVKKPIDWSELFRVMDRLCSAARRASGEPPPPV